MPARRQRKREERQAFGRGGSATRYQMRQKMFALGQDFYIENEQGQKVFKVDGKVLRVRDTLYFRDAKGNELCKLQQKVARIKDSMEIEGPDGNRLAMVKKAIITPVRDRWTVKIGNGPDLDIQGNILDHEYNIEEGRTKVAEVSKKWFRVRDSYGVEVAPGHEDILLLAASVAIDMMAHEGR